MSLKLVYEPLKIKGLERPNRIERSAHGANLTNYGAITDRLIDYHVARAKGGVGLTILEAATVHPTSALSLANQIGRAHVLTPVTNAHLVCRLLLEKKKQSHILSCTQKQAHPNPTDTRQPKFITN